MSDINLDCGDNSCIFATNKGGMRTNGGCRCFEAHGFHRSITKSAQIMLPEILKLKAALESICGVCSCPSTEEYPYGRALGPIEIHEKTCDYGIKRDALK